MKKKTAWAARVVGVSLAAAFLAACSSAAGGDARIEPGANDPWSHGAVPARTPWGAVVGGACVDSSLSLCASARACCASDAVCCDDGSCADDCGAPALPNGCPDYAPYPCGPDECCSSEPSGGGGEGSGTWSGCGCTDPTACCADNSCNCGTAPVCTVCTDGTNCCADGTCGC
jgi:hypothetical protein